MAGALARPQCSRLVGRFQAFRDDAGRLHRLIGVNLDITARRQAEDEIRSLNEELERRVRERTVQLDAANRELEAFSYSVAHDLRAPLRAMCGFARIVLDDYQDKLDGEGIGYLRRIQGNAMLMGQLIDALLELGRVTRADLQPVRTDLSAIARSIASRQGDHAARRGRAFTERWRVDVRGPRQWSRVRHDSRRQAIHAIPAVAWGS
jgi:light-regulated signal transduction histidine kinase (bacteriophytochrome)